MAGKTLYHFLTGQTDSETRDEFMTVLSFWSRGNPKGLDRFIRNIDKARDKEDQKRLQGLEKFLSKLGIKKTGFLELDPEEIKRLFESFPEDRLNVVDIDLEITPDVLDPLKTDSFDSGKIVELVNRYYNENFLLMDRPDDIQYDRTQKLLHFKGFRRIAESLLKEIGVRSDLIPEILDQGGLDRRANEQTHQVDLGDIGISTSDAKELENAQAKLKSWLLQEGMPRSKATIDLKQDAVVFRGSATEFRALLKEALQLSDNQIRQVFKVDR